MKSLQVRDVPDALHDTLIARAHARGMSLRQYVIEVLNDHCVLPTMDEWLDGLRRLTPAAATVSGADAVRGAREADDTDIARARRSR